jgi:ElaB/YqjD/DUF883 family membrane-anchored ribosome-binding protein
MSKSFAKKITTDLEPLLDEVVAAFKDGASEISEEAAETLANATLALAEAARSLVEEAKQRSTPIVRSAAKEFKQHPVATAATLAVAAAAVAGVLASRRKSLNA